MLTSPMNGLETEKRSSHGDLFRLAASCSWAHLPMDPDLVHHIPPLHSGEPPRY